MILIHLIYTSKMHLLFLSKTQLSMLTCSLLSYTLSANRLVMLRFTVWREGIDLVVTFKRRVFYL